VRRALVFLLLLSTAASVQAAQIKFFLGPAVSTYTGRWPSDVFPDPMGRPSGLNPFRNKRTGSLQGFGLEFPLKPWLGVEIDGLYFALGSSFTSPTAFFTVQREIYDLEGLSVPILAKLKPRAGLFPYFLAGVDFVFVLYHARTSLVLPEAGVIYREIAREDLMLATRKLDWQPVVGIGFEVTVLKQTFFTEARYRLGMMDLVKGFPASDAAARIRSLCFVVGYRM